LPPPRSLPLFPYTTLFRSLAELSQKWFHDPGYSHGILVPMFAGFLLWARRQSATGPFQPDLKLGSLGLLAAIACRVASGIFVFPDRKSTRLNSSHQIISYA